ncbi:MAG: TonB-dependent receptor [Bacteroidia bacterium]
MVCLASLSAWGQNRVISGIISDESGVGVAGVTVAAKGSTQGTFSGPEGKFVLSVPAGTEMLVVSMIGYATEELPLPADNVLNISLKPTSYNLDEVVVVGYGTQRRKDLTGAISSIQAEDIQNIPMPGVDQLLQGRAAGVTVTQNSGQPGSSVSVRIRGVTSITGSNEPLYIIDGVPISGDGQKTNTSGRSDAVGFSWSGGGNGQTAVSPLAVLNPNDIASIEILKDASAQAIYGSRAANGVVLITTKRGQLNESRVNYDGYVGVQEPARLLDVLDLREYAQFQNELGAIFGIQPRAEFADPSLLGPGTNWQEEIFQRAIMQNHQVSVSGGRDQISYYFSAGYLNQEGMVIGSGFDRYTTRLNVDNRVKKWLKLGISLNMSRTDEQITLNDDAEGVVSRAVLQGPDVPVRNPDGSFGGPPANAPEAPQSNPVAQALMIQNRIVRNKVIGSIHADMYLLPWLTFRTEVNGDFTFRNSPAFRPTYQWGTIENTVATGLSTYEHSQWWVFKNYLTFEKYISGHNITAMVGHEAQEARWRGMSGVRARFPTNDLPVLGLGDPSTAANGEYKGSTALESYFARATHSYNNRYSLTATLRADGSSKFDPNGDNQWGYFPAIGLAWNISEEAFLKDVKWISNLKVRGGYGEVGNQDVPNYLFGVGLSQVQSGIGVGFLPDKIANSQLKWESATQLNLGFDMGFFSDRIVVALDLYRKRSRDFLYQLPLPDYLGVSGTGSIGSPWVNLGEMQNTGMDLSIQTLNIASKRFTWSSSLIFSHYQNKVLDIQELPLFERVQFGFFTVTNTTEGYPIGHFWGLESMGLFTDEETLNNAPLQFGRSVGQGSGQTWLGDVRYRDVNEDGVINDDDATFIGSPHPRFSFGFSNNLRYRVFDLSVFLQGVEGVQVLNFFSRNTLGMAALYNNQSREVLDYYSEALGRTDTDIPRPVPGSDNPNLKVSDRFVENASYLRIQNVALGYNMPASLLQKTVLGRVRIYASVQNLYTFTQYSGLDPEVGSYNQKATLANVDNGRYPLPRTYTLGLNVEF